MRVVAHTAGGRHGPDYWACAQILCADILRTNDVSVGHEATPGAAEPATMEFVPSLAGRAGLRRITLALKNDLHPPALCLVGEQVAAQTAGHLRASICSVRPILRRRTVYSRAMS